jgi:hypothetical protein
MAKKPKDLSPFAGLAKMLADYFASRPGGIGGSQQQYPGAMRAGWSPQIEMSRNFMQQRAAGGQPQAWQKAGNFADLYGSGYGSGVFNPMTGQTQYPDVRSLGQGGMPPPQMGGMGQGGMQGGGGMPGPSGGGGQGGMQGGGGMDPRLMMLLRMLMGGGQGGGNQGGGDPRTTFTNPGPGQVQ